MLMIPLVGEVIEQVVSVASNPEPDTETGVSGFACTGDRLAVITSGPNRLRVAINRLLESAPIKTG